MNDTVVRQALAGQYEAALAMLDECLEKCPTEHWEGRIAKYPFWHVAYHTLCFIECYLARSNEAMKEAVEERVAKRARGETAPDFHPRGMQELEDEYPSRPFSREALLAYAAFCRARIGEVLRGDGDETLDGPSGFPWLPFTRLETHVYGIRHVQHHAGQLGAFLRNQGVEVGWAKSGER